MIVFIEADFFNFAVRLCRNKKMTEINYLITDEILVNTSTINY